MRTINLSHNLLLPADTFLLYPQNKGFLRGYSRRLHGRYEAQAGVLLLVLLICSALALMWSHELSDWVRLTYHGRETQGVITGHQITRGKSTNYYLFYSYELPQSGGTRRFSADENVPRATYSAFSPGAGVTVRYVPDAPHISSIQWTPALPIWKTIGLTVATLGTCFVTRQSVLTLQTLRLLRREGWVVSGRVSSANIESSRNGQRLNVVYQFTAPDQRVLRGSDNTLRNDLKGKLPQPGTLVAVLYVSPEVFQIL